MGGLVVGFVAVRCCVQARLCWRRFFHGASTHHVYLLIPVCRGIVRTARQPVFALLPLLEASSSHFCSREQLLSENQQFHALWACRQLDLDLVCDVKQAGGDSYFKLNSNKLLAWLRSRVERIVTALVANSVAGCETVGASQAVGRLVCGRHCHC